MSKPLIQIFSKYPKANKVKTRLIPELGAVGALDVYKNLLFGTFKTVDRLSYNFSCELWLDKIQLDFIPRQYIKTFSYIYEQKGFNLGEKMLYAITSGLSRSSKVILIGCDCLMITPEYYVKLANDLDEFDTVIIPATDGGYVLFATTRIKAEWFQNISWGTSSVMQQTLDIMNQDKSNKLKVYPPLRDLDNYQDYIWYKNNKLI